MAPLIGLRIWRSMKSKIIKIKWDNSFEMEYKKKLWIDTRNVSDRIGASCYKDISTISYGYYQRSLLVWGLQ